MEMVIRTEYVLKVDRQGRVVLPVEFRREVGIKNGGSIVLKKKNSRIYVEAGGDLEGEVEQWKEKLKTLLRRFTEDKNLNYTIHEHNLIEVHYELPERGAKNLWIRW